MSKKIEIKLIKSAIGYKSNAKKTLIALGLTKMNKTITKSDSPQIRGMIKSIEYLLQVKEI
jgi:large subunit ribosomal protein L30